MTGSDLWVVAREALTEKQWHVYELKHKHNLSNRQIALATGIAVETVRSHLAAADRRMVTALQRKGDRAA